MKISDAVDSLAALAQRLRLPGPTLSFHLNVLAAAGLIQAHKNGRSISYSANLDSVNRLTGFLMENCCGGRGGCAPFAEPANDLRALRQTAGKERKQRRKE